MAKTNNNVIEAPATPGRPPVFSFSVGVGSRKSFPSKWDDAQKWLISGQADSSPAHVPKHQHHHKPIFTEDHHPHPPHDQPFNDPPDIFLKDKLTNAEGEDNQFSRFKCVVPINQGFVLRDVSTEMVVDEEVKGESCPTPYKSVSPPRHTTPASMSGPLTLLTNTSLELQECHLAKLQPGTGNCNWTSREEEEEDVSKSLRHFEINNNNNNNECPKTIPPCAWEQEQTARSHQRYQREEAKIEAWVNLQNAKAEAESRKLEVKIQKMRSKFEEKMMKRMTSVHRKAEEMRAAAQSEHNMQPPKSTNKSKDLNESLHFSTSCTCFPCSQTVKKKF